MYNFFRFHFAVVPRGADRIATPLFYMVYIPVQIKKTPAQKKYTLNRQEGLQDEWGMQRWNGTFISSQQLRKE